jgi:hypothetical protein
VSPDAYVQMALQACLLPCTDLPPIEWAVCVRARSSHPSATAQRNMLQHSATRCKTSATCCNTRPTCCKTLQPIALQVAYFRDNAQTFGLTYESSMMRLFRNGARKSPADAKPGGWPDAKPGGRLLGSAGRTETIRSVSAESCAFVRAFASKDKAHTADEKLALLRAACERHAVRTSLCALDRALSTRIGTRLLTRVP